MNNEIYQLYHVARCGSTLLSSILSTVVETYTEPSWARNVLAEGGNLYKQTYTGKLIKFPSLVLMNPVPTELGKKIFLYRPLIQHLYKIKHVQDDWKKARCEYLHHIIHDQGYSHEISKVKWKPSTDMELIAYQWLCSLFEMSKHQDVLWIRSNDFFLNKVETVNLITRHFNLPTVKNYDYVDIDVKKLKINGNDSPCEIKFRISQSPNDDINHVSYNHGVIETDTAKSDDELAKITSVLLQKFPSLEEHFY